VTRRKQRKPTGDWWETGIGGPPSDDVVEAARKHVESLNRMREEDQFEFWNALSAYFGDGAPEDWRFALLEVQVGSAPLTVADMMVIGKRGCAPYREFSERFVLGMQDLVGYCRRFGRGPKMRFALERAVTRWSVMTDPLPSVMRDWMTVTLGYTDWTPESGEVP
jgi:hypothetical protein